MKKTILLIAFAISTVSFLYAQEINYLESDGGGEYIFSKTENCLTEDDRAIIFEKINENIAELKKQGKLPISQQKNLVEFDWPLQKKDELPYNSYYGISNFVDHNNGPALLDYNCDERTYDGHKGTDYATWPFPWHLVENDFIEVIAAEAGTIVLRQDGYADDHCSCYGTWNAVYVSHSDGSVAWYGHLKKNSLTDKKVGDEVAKGEFLGIVASSGCSTGPHLHLEVYDSTSSLVDPYTGNCNSLNTDTWWSTQMKFREPTINAVLTHYAEPEHGCPGTDEEPHFSNDFNEGDKIYMATYYHDQTVNSISTYKVRRPDNSIWKQWTHQPPQTYNFSWWWWSWYIPSIEPHGVWEFEVTYNGETVSHNFNYGDFTPVEEIIDENKINIYPNPTTGLFEINANKIEKAEIKIIDTKGRIMSGFSFNENLLDISDFPNGVYFISLIIDELKFTKRVVKM